MSMGLNGKLRSLIVSVKRSPGSKPLAQWRAVTWQFPKEAAIDNAAFARANLALVPGSTTLVVGHSNTIPEIIEKLGGGAVKIKDSEYDHLYVVTIEGGKGRLLALRY